MTLLFVSSVGWYTSWTKEDLPSTAKSKCAMLFGKDKLRLQQLEKSYRCDHVCTLKEQPASSSRCWSSSIWNRPVKPSLQTSFAGKATGHMAIPVVCLHHHKQFGCYTPASPHSSQSGSSELRSLVSRFCNCSNHVIAAVVSQLQLVFTCCLLLPA